MSKNAKLLLSLTAIALLIVVYFLLSTRPITVKQSSENTAANPAALTGKEAAPVDLAALENNYKSETKSIVKEFEGIADVIDESDNNGSSSDTETLAAATTTANNNNLAEEISLLRDQLMNMTVPAQFKDLHLNLVLAFSRMEDYLSAHKKDDKNSSNELITQAKLKNDWLD